MGITTKELSIIIHPNPTAQLGNGPLYSGSFQFRNLVKINILERRKKISSWKIVSK